MVVDVLLIDGKHTLWRSADAFKELWITNPDGDRIQTGAMFGFLNIVTRVKELFARRKSVVVVCWEGGPLKRRKMFAGYKDRNKDGRLVPLERLQLMESVAAQQTRLQGFLSDLGVPQAHSPGWEADDVLGTLAERWKKVGKVGIFTGDRDLLQCLDERVCVIRPEKGDFTVETVDTLREKLGLTPAGYVYAKALAGDHSDCIPGVKGIGPKTAFKAVSLLEAERPIESVSDLASRLDGVKLSDRIRGELAKAKEKELPLWYDLSRIRRDVKVRFTPTAPLPMKKIVRRLFSLRFRSWLQPVKLRSLVSLGSMRGAD